MRDFDLKMQVYQQRVSCKPLDIAGVWGQTNTRILISGNWSMTTSTLVPNNRQKHRKKSQSPKTLSTILTQYKVVASIDMWTKLSEQSL